MEWDEPGDDYMTAEQASDAGWLDPDSVEELKRYIQFLDIPAFPTRGLAALILVEAALASRPTLAVGSDEHVMLDWARIKLAATPVT